MPLQQTSGNVTADAYGGGVAAVPNYIEDVFSTYLYTGNGSTQTITNGIDLAGKGGLVWCKGRSGSFGSGYHLLQDSARGFGNSTALSSNATDAQYSSSGIIQSVSSTGFVTGSSGLSNASSTDYASWTFRKQPKFFDVVTTTSQTFSHSLASVAGCVIWKRTDASEDWNVVSRKSDGSYVQLNLNLTDGAFASYANAAAAGITSTTITLPSFTTGGTYVAYLFAHDAGGFGLTGTDNVISCGSFSGNTTVDLGYEPQWVLLKNATSADNWYLIDNMRGWPVQGNGSANTLYANSSIAEQTGDTKGTPTATGFTTYGFGGSTGIYIAIRRGPMKVPTSGTSVLQTLTYTGNGSSGRIYSGVTTVPDLAIATSRSNTSPKNWCDRLRGENPMISTSTDGESGTSQEGKTIIAGSANGTVTFGSYWGDAAVNTNGYTYVNYLLSRAPSFFDEVCYTGTGANRTVTHNLGVAPELIIVKIRDAGAGWYVYNKDLTSAGYYLLINSTAAQAFSNGLWNSTQPTSSSFTVGTGSGTNGNGSTYVAYLFATCAGVSKVGSYTGTGTTLQVDCGFTGGARFVLIKRTDSTGDWYVWDSARGMVSGTDPSLLLNSTAAEVNANSVYAVSTGFQIVSTAAGINASGGTYIFLSVA